MTVDDDSPVDLRCAVAVIRGDSILLVQRHDRGDWVLPGGRPRAHENMGSCARREVREETGLDVHPNQCGLVLEVNDPVHHHRIVELVFIAEWFDDSRHLVGEPGRDPQWVDLPTAKRLPLSPPIGGFLFDLAHGRGQIGRYVGNLWRPVRGGP
ncbi:NUDIX hydrolase [uncultured Mycobacterium sp.]|uniref:NUDIX hydrolase n=1 Tax=uncultured Mycobacterium sp. TaxID=171292 RepID=A0A1Y5PPT5_9MYCO|nr:NUDIX hydrolase [uncultured Mycobacterium sp.]